MSAKDLAKVVWRWSAIPRQVAEDIQCHWRHRDLPVPLLRRLLEQERLLWSNRMGALEYYQLGLFDPTIAAAAKRKYVGRFQTWRLFYAFNAKEYHHLTDKKLEFHAVAAKAALPVPEILAVVTQNDAAGAFHTIRSEAALRQWLEENQVADVVLKPVAGIKGWGVLSLGRRTGDGVRWHCLPGDKTVDIAALWAHCSRYLDKGGMMIQRRLQPHPDLARLQPDVLHTVRVITYVKPEPRILDAILRVGGGKTSTDNISGGGIAVPLDLATGRCGRGSMLVGGLPRYVDDHPASGARITGLLLPGWREVCAVAKSAAQAFNVQATIGWDIGLTADGPVLLEGNWYYGLRANQLANRRGMLATPWVEAFNREGAYRSLGLGFSNRPRV